MVAVTSVVSFAEERKIVEFIEEKKLPTFKYPVEKRRFIKKCSKFTFQNGLLYLQDDYELLKVICEEDTPKIQEVLDSIHLVSHHGEKKMWYAITREYSGIKREVLKEYLANCEECQHYQALKTTDVVKNIRASRSFERLQIDLVDLRKFSSLNDGFNWMLNVIDVFSKYLFSFKLKDKSAIEVISILFKLIFRFPLF